MTASTGRAGVVLAVVALLLPAGLFALLRRPRQAGMAVIVVAGLLLSVLPAALRGEGGSFQRAMTMIVFVAIIAGAGFDWLWRFPHRAGRAAAVALAVAGVLQFGMFYRDFLTHYKLRSAFYYDPSAFAGIAAALLERDAAPAFYLSTELDTPGAKWRYYTTVANKTDLLTRTHYVDRAAFPLDAASPGSLCVINVDRQTRDALQAHGKWQPVVTILDVDNREAAQIFRKVP
jgi:hypothetical protein